MRNLIDLLALFCMITGCNKGDDSGSVGSGIVIIGTIGGNPAKSSGLKSVNTPSLGDAKQVLVFNSSGGYKLFPVGDSSFTAKAVAGIASALVFIDEANMFIGCLNAGGLNVLPLVSLKTGTIPRSTSAR